MRIIPIAGLLVIIVGLSGCKVDSPQGISSAQAPEFVSQTVSLSIENISLRYNPFSTRSEISCTVRNKNSGEVNINNYAVHYSFNGSSFVSSLKRALNPTTVELTSNNGYRSNSYFVIGSQPVLDAKGSSDRVYVKIVLTGLDSAGAIVTYEFTTTWII